MTNIVAVLIVRCTHTGVYADGRPNTGSVTIYDLDEITIQKNRTRYVPIPPGATVDIPMSTRTFVSWHQGDICKFTVQGLITSEIILQLRDKSDCGGPAGTGQTLRPAVLNIERVGNVLRMVLPDNVIPTTLETLGFLVGEPIAVTGLTGAFRDLNDDYVISTASPGTGLAGAAVGSYLIEVPSVGADIAAATLAGVNICLTEGRVTVQFNGNGDVGGLGADVFGYIGGQLFPNAGGGAGTVAVFDEGILIDAAVSTFDFIGAGVTVTSAGAGAVDVTIPGGGGAVTLQQAYDNGNTIVTSATSGDLLVSGTESIGLDASQISHFTVTGADLTLSTAVSGDVNILSADLMTIFSGADLDIDATGDITIDSTGSFSVDGVGSSNITTTTGTLDILTLTSGPINVAAADGVLVRAGDEAAAAGNDAIFEAGDGGGANDGGEVAVRAGDSGAGATGDGGDVLVEGGDALSTNGSGGDLLLTTGAGTGTGSAGTVSLTGPNDEDEALATLTTTGTNGDSVQAFVGDSDPSGSVTGLAGSVFFRDTGTTGELYLNVSTVSGTDWDRVVTETTEGTEVFTSGEALTAGDLLALDTAGDVIRANSSIAAANYEVIGVSAQTVGIGVAVRVITHSGVLTNVNFTAAPAAAANGSFVFLSTTSGLASTSPPAPPGGNAFFTVGTLQGADGVSTSPAVVFRPQFLALHP